MTKTIGIVLMTTIGILGGWIAILWLFVSGGVEILTELANLYNSNPVHIAIIMLGIVKLLAAIVVFWVSIWLIGLIGIMMVFNHRKPF